MPNILLKGLTQADAKDKLVKKLCKQIRQITLDIFNRFRDKAGGIRAIRLVCVGAEVP